METKNDIIIIFHLEKIILDGYNLNNKRKIEKKRGLIIVK